VKVKKKKKKNNLAELAEPETELASHRI